MKAVTISKQGAPVAPNIKVVDDWPEPQPGPGQVLVRTEASAMNHLDLFVAMGLPGVDLTYPRIGGSDGAGIVEAVGEGVDESWIGKRIVLNAAMRQAEPAKPNAEPLPISEIQMIGEHTHGTHAEKFIAPVTNVLDIGDADPAEAAAFALTHLTAWRMVWSRAQLQPGQWVLIPGIGGGVALALLNIAGHFNCRTIVTSRHQHKLDKAKQLGATHAILDEGEPWAGEVLRITSNRGVDICADSVGKAIFDSCLKSLTRGGVFVTCGVTSGFDPKINLGRVFWNQLSVIGSTMGDMDEFRQIIALFTNGDIKPVIDDVKPAEEATSVYERLENAEQFGKLVLKW